MSYLNAARLHFAGEFRAAPSTVNNRVQNFDPGQFDPGAVLWNPEGTHAFRFDNCHVTSVRYADGTSPATGADAVLQGMLTDAGRPAAKLVDLDPQQQMVSMIFGLRLSLSVPGAPAFLAGSFVPAPFSDLWFRAGARGDGAMGAFFQSQLAGLQWGDVSSSRFLRELRDASADGVLSIKFNVDVYSMKQGPRFAHGRIVGTLGPATRDEPRHFVIGRHLAARAGPIGPNSPNYCVAVLNEIAAKIHLDLGNALPTRLSSASAADPPLADIGPIALAFIDAGGRPQQIDKIDYLAPDFYRTTAGIVDVPADRGLSAAELSEIRQRPLALVASSGSTPGLLVGEPTDGKHLRADMFVARLNPGDEFAVQFRATQFGQPLAGARVVTTYQPRSADPGEPPINEPRSALPLPGPVVTDAQGRVEAHFRGANPGNPRKYIDGQVYFVDYAIEGSRPLNDNDFLSVLVWDDFTPDDPPTWLGSMRPIFQQYASLYPYMKNFFDMGSYDEVIANAGRIVQTISLDISDPRYMPVTRDLSNAKRQAIVRWLTQVDPTSGKPLLGVTDLAGASGAAFAASGADDESKTRALLITRAARQRAASNRRSTP